MVQRLSATGRVQQVTIKVYDAGPDEATELRYRCEARTEDGRIATGAFRAGAEEAVGAIRWEELDR